MNMINSKRPRGIIPCDKDDENHTTNRDESSILHRSLHAGPPVMIKQSGNYYWNDKNEKIFDAATGAAVVCLGYGNPRIIAALNRQSKDIFYCSSTSTTTLIGEEYGYELLKTTGGMMKKACFYNSGSEAMEAALKCATQYHQELPEPRKNRINFITRHFSYHGTTLGALSVSGHVQRRKCFQQILLPNASHVSSCNPYHDRASDETIQQYKDRLLKELDEKFLELGPETVIAFIVEPVVGATLGCVPSIPGLLQGYRDICDKHGALLIFDEVMCGMGRCGTMHAWQLEGVVPDLQTVGKGLGGGYPISGMLMSHHVAKVFKEGTGQFSHGHTHQGNPLGCAVGLEVLKIIDEENLLENVNRMGNLLSQALRNRLEHHAHVGDIRGVGLFWGIEFVKDKRTKEPFDPALELASKIHDKAIGAPYHIRLYPGSGTKDGEKGDHVLIAPPYNVTEMDVKHIVEQITQAIEAFFLEFTFRKSRL